MHISELGADYFVFNEASHDLRGERTGIRYKLTDAVQVQVARVDLEARRIDFRLVKGTGYDALMSPANDNARGKPQKKAAPAKPRALKGTSSERRATARKAAKAAARDKNSKARAAKKRVKR